MYVNVYKCKVYKVKVSLLSCVESIILHITLYMILHYICCCLCSSANFTNRPINIGRLTVDCNGGEQKITDCNITAAEPSSLCSLQFHLTCCKFITQCVYAIIIKMTYVVQICNYFILYQLLTGMFHCMELSY